MYPEKEKYILLMFQNITQIVKHNYSFNDSKKRRMVLSLKKAISLINCNNFQTGRWFLLSDLPSFFRIRKKNVNLIKNFMKNIYNVVVPSKDTKILEFNQYQK